PLAAMMSTVDSMLLVTSSAIVKDIYLNFINPKASDKKISKLSYLTTLIIGIFMVIFALSPPEYLQFIVVYAIGGLASAFFAPVIFGLYWKRSSTWGGTVSMYIGLISYVMLSKWSPDPFGMNAIVTS